MSKPPKVVIPGLNRGIGVPSGYVLGRLPGTGKGPAQLLDLASLRRVGLATAAHVTQNISAATSTTLSETTSLSSAVSTVDAGQSTSLSQVSSSLSGAISSTASLSGAVSTVDSNQSTSLSQVSSSLSGATSSTTSLSDAIHTFISNSGTTAIVNALTCGGPFTVQGATMSLGPTAGPAADSAVFFENTNVMSQFLFRQWAGGVPVTLGTIFGFNGGFIYYDCPSQHHFRIAGTDTAVLSSTGLTLTGELLVNMGALATQPFSGQTPGILVQGPSGAQARFVLDAFGAGSAPHYYGRIARLSGTAPAAIQITDPLVQFSGLGYGATGYSSGPRGQLRFEASENWSDTAQGARLSFRVTASGTTTLAEAMSIENDGTAIFSGLTTLTEFASASVPTPAAGRQTLFIDTADHKLKRKDSGGIVTTIA